MEDHEIIDKFTGYLLAKETELEEARLSLSVQSAHLVLNVRTAIETKQRHHAAVMKAWFELVQPVPVVEQPWLERISERAAYAIGTILEHARNFIDNHNNHIRRLRVDRQARSRTKRDRPRVT